MIKPTTNRGIELLHACLIRIYQIKPEMEKHVNISTFNAGIQFSEVMPIALNTREVVSDIRLYDPSKSVYHVHSAILTIESQS
jgi:hypothetical protein